MWINSIISFYVSTHLVIAVGLIFPSEVGIDISGAAFRVFGDISVFDAVS